MSRLETLSATRTSGAAPVLVARSLHKNFESRGPKGLRRSTGMLRAVNDVDVELFSGRTLAIVGESGSGKSTVARLLAQLTRPTSGEVLLDGKPVRIRSERARRVYTGEVQLLLQDPFASLNPLHTIRYQLSRVLRIHNRALARRDMEKRIHELLETVQLPQPQDYLDKYPHQLSGGQLQRVAIARTLAAQPRILLLDEPVSMLDVSIRLGVLNLLQELKDLQNLAMLYITHDIASARYFADDIKVMYRGKMVEAGSSESVTQDPAHPYTQLLISSAPDPSRRGLDPDTGKSMTRPPVDVADACPFAGRCPDTMEICTTSMPDSMAVGEDHAARCWLLTESA